MSLTRSDIQILQEAFQPEFVKIEKIIDNKIDGLKQYVDERFNTIDKRFEQIDVRFNEIDNSFERNEISLQLSFKQLITDLYELYTPRDEHEELKKRVTEVETKLMKHSF